MNQLKLSPFLGSVTIGHFQHFHTSGNNFHVVAIQDSHSPYNPDAIMFKPLPKNYELWCHAAFEDGAVMEV
jgi:hypothetical protein